MSRRAPLSRPGLAAGLALLLAAPVVLTAARAGTQPLVPGAKPDPIETFRLARIPYAAARGLYKDSPEFLAALAQQLAARRALLVLAPDYEHVVERLLTGEADAAWLGTLAFAEARARGIPLTPLVCPVRKTGKTYTGLIITHRDNNL
ncbi:MAG: PhnD/SsuA/transferrin family substrate-binding protein [Candidatus Wallbacteria bacterium]|nr:PhnD/SsuA/transferrin family substrate-binding protein [Candidatus Wallbacteria bacterium]